MNQRFSTKYYAYLLLWAVCLGLSAAARIPEPLLIAAPLFIALVAGLIPRSAPEMTVERSTGATQLFENDPISSSFSLHAKTDLPLVEAVYVLPPDAVLSEGTNTVVTCVPAGQRKQFAFTFRLPSRRVSGTGDLVIRVKDRTGFTTWEQRLRSEERRTVFPAPETAQSFLRPANTRVFAGTYPSPITGEGLEFADIRPFVFGDRTSRMNWKALARTGELYVNDYVTERNTDIVLLLDVFSDPGLPGRSLLDYSARGAATVAEHYLRDKNRVGLVELGYYLKYLLPAPGRKSWYRILSVLSEMKSVRRYVSYDIEHIPPKVLPPQAMIVAFTGLCNDSFAEALVDLKSRGFDVAVVHISLSALLFGAAGRFVGGTPVMTATTTLWKLYNEQRVTSLREAGLDAATWNIDEPFTTVIRQLDVLRRGGRRSR